MNARKALNCGAPRKQLPASNWLVAGCLFFGLGCAVESAAKAPTHAEKPAVVQGKPFLGCSYKNIKWIKHVRLNAADWGEDEAGSGGQEDIGGVDLDGDKKSETIKAIWGPGVSDHSLLIEVYKNKKKIDTLKPLAGIQPNYSVEDGDGDGRMEIVIWAGLWDFRLPGEDGITDKTYEGHSGPHRYIVATYKLVRGEYNLWDVYTTKKKHEPFCEKKPVKD